MIRALMLSAFVPLVVCVAGAQQPFDPGRPPGQPGGLGTAFVFNNTSEDIVFVLSSARGTVRSNLRPGWAYPTYFERDGRLRVLTTFRAVNGDILSNRTIKPIDGNFYDAIAPTPPPVTATKTVTETVEGRAVTKQIQVTEIPADQGKKREVPQTQIQRVPMP